MPSCGVQQLVSTLESPDARRTGYAKAASAMISPVRDNGVTDERNEIPKGVRPVLFTLC